VPLALPVGGDDRRVAMPLLWGFRSPVGPRGLDCSAIYLRGRAAGPPSRGAATARPGFFPRPPSLGFGGLPREPKKPALTVLRWRFGLVGCGPLPLRLSDRHQGRDGHGRETRGD